MCVCVEHIGQKSAHSEWYVYKFLSLLDSDRQWQDKWMINLASNFIYIRKSKDYVYGKWVYKVLGIWKGYYRVKKIITSFMHETVNRGKK